MSLQLGPYIQKTKNLNTICRILLLYANTTHKDPFREKNNPTRPIHRPSQIKGGRLCGVLFPRQRPGINPDQGGKEMIISIPLSCPKCGAKLQAVRYDVLLNILKKRSWHVCTVCNYEREVDDFKRELCCI